MKRIVRAFWGLVGLGRHVDLDEQLNQAQRRLEMGQWHVEDLGRGNTRMRREVNANLTLLVGNDHWVAYDPKTDGPSLEVCGGMSSREDGMRAADRWALKNGTCWYVVNEFEVGDDGYCKVYTSYALKESAEAYMVELNLDGDNEAGITFDMVAQGFISIRNEVPRIEDLPWLNRYIPSDEDVRSHVDDLDEIEAELHG